MKEENETEKGACHERDSEEASRGDCARNTGHGCSDQDWDGHCCMQSQKAHLAAFCPLICLLLTPKTRARKGGWRTDQCQDGRGEQS